jgi:hypothetical protein
VKNLFVLNLLFIWYFINLRMLKRSQRGLNRKQANLTQNEKKRAKNIFKIIKIKKDNEYLEEIYHNSWYLNEVLDNTTLSRRDESTLNERICAENNLLTKKSQRIINGENLFSELSEKDMTKRMKKLSKEIKKMKRQMKNKMIKVRRNRQQLLDQYLSEKIPNSILNGSFLNFDHLKKTLKILANGFSDFSDENKIIQNFISLISENKLPLESLKFKHICSLLRPLVEKEKHSTLKKKNNHTQNKNKINISSIEENFFSNLPKNFIGQIINLDHTCLEDQSKSESIIKPSPVQINYINPYVEIKEYLHCFNCKLDAYVYKEQEYLFDTLLQDKYKDLLKSYSI